ncbi:LPS export ABC transporter periplasmic protein LptC [Chitinophaga lutea]|uniref:LPS export ABC transporter periplasmic protein LptC n=1 Tax=Chitinophaga lutea TaxID=2488634 RepID=A0A3N4QBJ4_9BACT|nr:LPS export ABC transporter periplasmic protein LptC [Chitinophaga lutea]RPE13347.1 LPS export ABC transporter periplasmic protein LptC [Chitinophaga lutea]
MKQLLSYLAIVLVCCSCENDINAVRKFDANKLGVEQGFDVETIMSQTANVKGILTSPYMERHTNTPSYTEFPRGLKVVFYDSLKISSVLTARYGKYMDRENDVYLRDSVVFISLKDPAEIKRLDCKDLRWDAKRALFTTDKYCRFSTPYDTLYGVGFDANQDFSWSEFHNVHGSFKSPDSSFVQ